MKQATAQDTFDHVLESGFVTFTWWTGVTVTGRDTPGWEAVAVSADLDDPADTTQATVSHQVLLRAARRILKAPPRYMSQDCVRQCRNLLFRVDECDFDACSGDQLMQFVVLGEIIYG